MQVTSAVAIINQDEVAKEMPLYKIYKKVRKNLVAKIAILAIILVLIALVGVNVLRYILMGAAQEGWHNEMTAEEASKIQPFK